MKKFLLTLLVVIVAAAFSSPVVAKRKGPERLRFDLTQATSIDFSHGLHERAISDCKTCHHMGVGTGTCRDCHGVHAPAPSMKRAMHKSCRGCHAKKKISKKRDCNFCHKQN